MREFLHVDDMADASVYLATLQVRMQLLHMSMPDGRRYSHKDLAELIRQIVGFR